MGLNAFLTGLSNLEKINRAPGFFKYTEHSVAAHSFRVAMIAQTLGDIEEKSGTTINWKILYEKALNHDYSERFIGDIKTPVKYASPDLREMLADVEEKMVSNFIEEEIPVDYKEDYLRRLSEGKDDTVEGEILAISDKVDLLYESYEEISKNNPDGVYKEMFREAMRTIRSYRHRPSVDYFFQYIFPELLQLEFYGKEDFLLEINAIFKEK